MDNRVDFVFGKDLVYRLGVADVSLIKRNLRSRYLLNSLDRFGTGVGVIVGDNDRVSCLDQFNAGVAADVACTACQ